MKSKKWVSLALAVALSASALGVYAAAPDAGVTAYASVKYSDGSVAADAVDQRYAVFTLTAKQLEDNWKKSGSYNFTKKFNLKNKDGTPKYEADGTTQQTAWLRYDELKGNYLTESDVVSGYEDTYRVGFWFFNLDDAKITSLTFETYGWYLNSSKASSNKDDALKTNDMVEFTGNTITSSGLIFRPVCKSLNDEEIVQSIADKAAAAAEKKAADKRTNHCWGRAWRHSAGNSFKNVTNGVVDNIYLKGKLQKGSGSYSKEKISSIIKAVGADEEKEIVWVYDVSVPDTHELIDRKNAMVRLYVDTGYTTNGYEAYVYHVTEQGVTKVEGLDVGTYDVMFFARDFSPYVLILSPNKVDKYENPPTGDFDAVPMALFAAASLSATGAMLMRRKRELGE